MNVESTVTVIYITLPIERTVANLKKLYTLNIAQKAWLLNGILRANVNQATYEHISRRCVNMHAT